MGRYGVYKWFDTDWHQGKFCSNMAKKPNTIRICSRSFLSANWLLFSHSLIKHRLNTYFEPLAMCWAWEHRDNWAPSPSMTQELMIQNRAGVIFLPAIWETSSESGQSSAECCLWDRPWGGCMIYIPLHLPTTDEVGVPGPIFTIKKTEA